jgi:hypothetical protein
MRGVGPLLPSEKGCIGAGAFILPTVSGLTQRVRLSGWRRDWFADHWPEQTQRCAWCATLSAAVTSRVTQK